MVPEDLGVSMTNICYVVFASHLSLFWFSFHNEGFITNIKYACVWCLQLQQCDTLIATDDWTDK